MTSLFWRDLITRGFLEHLSKIPFSTPTGIHVGARFQGLHKAETNAISVLDITVILILIVIFFLLSLSFLLV